MTTSPKQTLLFGGDELTFLPEGSPVNPFHLQGKDLERQMTATSGRNIIERSARFNRLGLSGKTFLACLIGQEGWYSSRCRLIWKMKGTKSGRLYFQLAASTLPTEGTGFGLLPTPDCSDRRSDNSQQWGLSNFAKNNLLPTPTCQDVTTRTNKSLSPNAAIRPNIAMLAKNHLLPTPQAIDGNGQGRNLRLKKDCNRDPSQPGSWRGDLKDFAIMGMLPTPTANDSKNATMPESQNNRNGLTGVFHPLKTGKTSQLNPRFVAEMMGFPADWTELPFLNGETNRSKPTATP